MRGIGSKRLQALEAAGIATLRDLVYTLPKRYLDRTRLMPLATLREGDEAFFAAEILATTPAPSRLIVRVSDGDGEIDLVFFRGLVYLRPRLLPGLRLAVAGTVTRFRELQIAHPEWEILAAGEAPRGGLLPVYALHEAWAPARLDHRRLQQAALEALERFEFSDPLPAPERAFLRLRSEKEVLQLLHNPPALDAVAAAFAEIKTRELWPLCRKLESARRARRGRGRSFASAPETEQAARSALGFSLTAGQEEALRRIGAAWEQPAEFYGLLQGDVGSGKTAVALLAALRVTSAGAQAALLAPTEILAAQHFRTAMEIFPATGTEIALLTASTPPAERVRILDGLRSGALRLVVGTHALLASDVLFHELRFLIIDEQHRFGVDQRSALAAKGLEPHVLLLSATPIPRTLAQSLYGDLDVIALTEKPPGRLPVKTRLVPADKVPEMLGFLRRETQNGNQAYWVVPRIEAGDADFGGEAGVETAVRRLRSFSSDWRVEAVHGRVPAEARERALADFRAGAVQALVATTVIEVGVDVPAANLMVVEGAERFGLAQLHQLRGRTGRGHQQAWCFLLAPESGWPDDAAGRLREFAAVEDGFRIAELDLQRRGAGNLDGTQQSGFGNLRFADVLTDADLLRSLRARAAIWLDAPAA